jgi:cellulose synthase/poly-beta-1,6-N-acetylglucosamine synthase-like glycosyltransferase
MNESKLPPVSFVIISHNEEHNIRDCLDSLAQLDYPDDLFEVTVVDSSSDMTREIVREYIHVRLICSDQKGFSPKRNLGVRESRYDLIAFIDADCIVPSDWLKKMLNQIEGEDVAAVASNAYPPPDSPFWGKHVACLGRPVGGALGFDSYFVRLERGINVVATANALFKKEALSSVGGFDERKRFSAGGEDFDISQRLIKAGYVLEFEPDAFVYHKTRNLRNFLSWTYRQGVAQNLFYQTNRSLSSLLCDPFSMLWIFVLLGVFLVVTNKGIAIVALAALFLFVALILLWKAKSSNGNKLLKKLRLLVERRKRIGVNFFSIVFVILPLFYLERVVVNLGHMVSKLSLSRSSQRTG